MHLPLLLASKNFKFKALYSSLYFLLGYATLVSIFLVSSPAAFRILSFIFNHFEIWPLVTLNRSATSIAFSPLSTKAMALALNLLLIDFLTSLPGVFLPMDLFPRSPHTRLLYQQIQLMELM